MTKEGKKLTRLNDPAKNFENYIASLYEGLGFHVQTNVLLRGQQVDVLAEKLVDGIGLVRCAVECKYRTDRSVSNQDVFDFVAVLKTLMNGESGIINRLRSRSAYQGQWSRLRFSVLA